MISTVKLLEGDNRQLVKTLPDSSVDAIITDPPYELNFMGKKWDNSGIAYNVELWKDCLNVLKPGGYLLAFGGTRTYHRLAVAIEDAGFEIRDSIHWIYGSGFPKSLDVSKAIDKAAGAKQWEGWGTALKPAHEPIVLARKPLAEKTVAANVIKYGTGALNIDACRVGGDVITTHSRGKNTAFPKRPGETTVEESGRSQRQDVVDQSERAGRWPPNIVLTHSPDCIPTDKTIKVKAAYRPESQYAGSPDKDVYGKGLNQRMSPAHDDPDGTETIQVWDCTDDCPVAEMNRQSGVTKARQSGWSKSGSHASANDSMTGPNYERKAKPDAFTDTGGGASRFFPVFRYQAKASKKERTFTAGVHPTVKPAALIEWLTELVSKPGDTILDPFAGSGTTGLACVNKNRNVILIESDSTYCDIIMEKLN